MDLFLIILTVILAAAVIILAAFLIRQKTSGGDNGDDADRGFRLLLEQMNELSRVVDRKIGETHKIVSDSAQTQFGESKRLIQEINEQVGKNLLDVARGLTKLDETNRQVVSFADQLRSLQDILKNPKQRGVLGEYYLETLLKNALPPGSFKMQYAFSDGEIVDAAVFIKDKIVPIDSKFSLENYNRLMEEKSASERERLEKVFIGDLKLRIQETAKYIRPTEGTMEFAFMFIPHEAIYYDLLVNRVGGVSGEDDNLIQRAASKHKVIIVSPTSFLAYLQTVLQGLKALQIEETAKDIIKNVEVLGRHLKKYEEYYGKLGASLHTTVNHYHSAGKEFKKMDKDVMHITGEAAGVEVPVLDKPDEEMFNERAG